MHEQPLQLSAQMVFAFKVKSQLSAWTTSAAECVEGVGRKDLQLSAQFLGVEKMYS